MRADDGLGFRITEETLGENVARGLGFERFFSPF